ncbi:BnaA08g04620D [Brassica napus]|uniref:BnaA08g04620D protein n=1 Tax=Brassica napus TaxID=3708 RepID=A0A078HDK0_BRANA|nr:BnaA08g04620D [Brassica napus]
MAEELGCVGFLGEDDDLFLDFDLSLFTETPIAGDFIRSSPDSANSWIGDIESQLMNDEDNQNCLELDQQSVSEFLADIFVDDPTADSVTGKVDDVPTQGSDDAGKEKAVEKKRNDSGSENLDEAKVESEISGDDDAIAKKRRRRVRNRDAAVRSRERKKEYVTDLEKKRWWKCFHDDKAGVCCALVGIPAVGFPALVSGRHHLPIPPSPPTKDLLPSSGSRRTRKAGSKRARE